jgi:IclR family transcriptional regulator, KDG regulon repressor
MFKKTEQKPIASWEFATSLDKACDVLCCFTSMKPSWGISELARQLGLPKSGIFRIARTFERKGFLRRTPGSTRYELGYRMYELTGAAVGEGKWLCEKAAPYLWEIHKASGFTVSLRILEGDKLVVLDRIDGTHPLKVAYPVGAHLPCNHGAAGKLLLAYQRSMDEIAALIESGKIAALTPNTKVDVKSLDASFKTIKRCGYAITRGEALLGVIGLAVPVLVRDGSVKAALALAAPESLCPAVRIKEFVPLMKDAAERLSLELGHRRNAAVG